ncbi:MAG: DNA-directed RNA polymerase subunit B, partial [Candidatus Aenigmarchaeota archaeon]|nr:DNA-directed RNA polymerase subunit B [Candidatus Aenigmarchaeota archaeon]
MTKKRMRTTVKHRTGAVLEGRKREGKADVYYNGKFIGEVKSPQEFVEDIRKKRRLNILTSQLNISYHPRFREIKINTDHGRVRRPLIIVEAGKSKLLPDHVKQLRQGKVTWAYLMQHGIIEYLDADEEENTYIAMYPDDVAREHTHLEIDPLCMLGTSAALIPFPEYNRGDRINYGAKMVGQAIGLMISNFHVRLDTKFNTLAYPQMPMVKTKISNMLNEYPEGQNIVVAIMSYDGYNMNDAVVMNKSSVERGLFRSFYYRTYETIKKRYWGGQEDEIAIPEHGIKGHRGEEAYKNLGPDGIINLETPVESNSVLMGKISPLRFLSSEEFLGDLENKRETSVTVRHGEKGIADKVIISETPDANQLLKVRVRDERVPELGDKFATRHGQKG